MVKEVRVVLGLAAAEIDFKYSAGLIIVEICMGFNRLMLFLLAAKMRA